MPVQHAETGELSESHRIALVARWQEIDRLMSEVESVLAFSASNSVFPKYKSEVNPVQARVIRDYVANIRAAILESAKALGIELPPANLQPVHSMRVDLIFAEVAAEECTPERLRGYGELSGPAITQLRGMVEQMKSSIRKLMGYLSETADLSTRLDRLNRADNDAALLQRIISIVDRHGMVEFRPAISSILERLETNAFEIAVFGRVSSGKSSLLNHILETDVLPVGVTPVTAVPTRIAFGPKPLFKVTFTSGREDSLPLERLPEFVTEDQNRGNEKRITRLVVEIPSPRLRDGIVFVDTPGLGSLATAGAAETRAYLPRCDFGVVLIDAASTLTEEDLGTIRMLIEAGAPASALLSKADLIGPVDRERAIAYTRRQIREALGVDLPVRAVSVVAGEAALLESWFTEDLAPLYQRHSELAAESIQRKIGVLRESIESALNSIADKDPASLRPGQQAVARASSRLREATGAFERASRACFDSLDRLRGSRDVIISRLAREVIETPQEFGAERDGNRARLAVIRIAAGCISPVPGILADLAVSSAAALVDCAHDLRMSSAPAPGELTSAIREMPLMDLGTTEVHPRTGFLGNLSKAFALRGLERSLDEQIGAELERALSAYTGVLQNWLRTTLGDIRERFDSYAESYRAAIARMGSIAAPGQRNAGPPTPEAGNDLLRDLAELRGELPMLAQESGA